MSTPAILIFIIIGLSLAWIYVENYWKQGDDIKKAQLEAEAEERRKLAEQLEHLEKAIPLWFAKITLEILYTAFEAGKVDQSAIDSFVKELQEEGELNMLRFLELGQKWFDVNRLRKFRFDEGGGVQIGAKPFNFWWQLHKKWSPTERYGTAVNNKPSDELKQGIYSKMDYTGLVTIKDLTGKKVDPGEYFWETKLPQIAKSKEEPPIEILGPGIVIPPKMRLKHTYIIGKSGSGKTTLIQNMVIQDMTIGSKEKGLCVIAPDTDVFEEKILPFVPDERMDDVIYFNPSDPNCSLSINPLHVNESEDVTRKADEVYTALKRLFGSSTARMNEILRQTVRALVEIPGTTLFDVDDLLDRENPHFRNRVISQLKNPRNQKFWREKYESYPKDAAQPIMTRLAQFTEVERVANVVCKNENVLNFRQIMDEGKILLVNLTDGLLGSENAEILGQLVNANIQLAAMSRADIPEKKRKPFYFYVDEFQKYTGSSVSFDEILTRARKYGLALIFAHQQTDQIPDKLLNQIFGNCSTLIGFHVSNRDARKLMAEGIGVTGDEEKKPGTEIFSKLRVGKCHGKIGQENFTIQTPRPPEGGNPGRVADVIARFQGPTPPKSGADGMVIQPPVPGEEPPDEASTPGKSVFDNEDPDEVF